MYLFSSGCVMAWQWTMSDCDPLQSPDRSQSHTWQDIFWCSLLAYDALSKWGPQILLPSIRHSSDESARGWVSPLPGYLEFISTPFYSFPLHRFIYLSIFPLGELHPYLYGLLDPVFMGILIDTVYAFVKLLAWGRRTYDGQLKQDAIRVSFIGDRTITSRPGAGIAATEAKPICSAFWLIGGNGRWRSDITFYERR